MSEFSDRIRVELDDNTASGHQIKEYFRELLWFYLGSIFHEEWKKDDEVAYQAASEEKKNANWEKGEDGVLRKFKSVNGNVDGKEYVDKDFVFETGNPAYRQDKRTVDIRALTFEKLPLAWQKENIDAGKTAIELIYEKVLSGDVINLEELSAKVHEAWLSRPHNAWAIENQSEESKPYVELPESTKTKDRRHILLALELLGKVNEGVITYEELENKISGAMSRFNAQLRNIEEGYR